MEEIEDLQADAKEAQKDAEAAEAPQRIQEEERLFPISITGDTRAKLGAGIGLLDTLRGLGYRNCVFEVRPAVGQ